MPAYRSIALRCRFVLEDDAGAGGGGSGTQQAQSSVPAGQQETKEREVFVDVFGGGKIMSFEDVRWVPWG